MRVAVPLEQCWHEVPGGTARTAIDLTDAIAARGDVDVVGVAARHARPAPTPWTPSVPVRHFPVPRLALYESWHRLRGPLVERVTGPVDLTHAIGGAIPGSRAPLVVTVHDLAFLHHPEHFTRRGNHFFRRALALVRSEAAQVQVPSRTTLVDCREAGIDEGRLRLVPWGCTIGRPTRQSVDAARALFGLPDRYVVCVGTKEPRKNLPRLLEAWRRMARTEECLVVVGPTGWGDALDDADLPPNVMMAGFLDDDVRDALYAGATVSCYPSLFEGFGLPVLESMALGCPVVTSAGTSTEELVVDGAGLAVDPTDVDDIAAALASVLDDSSLRGALSEAGLTRAATYTWERAAEAAVAGYREVVR